MAKHMKRWLWAGAMAGTLALGTACSSTESKVLVAQADTTTTQPGTGGTGTSGQVPDTSVQQPGTVPATPTENPGSDPAMPGDTTSSAPMTPPSLSGDAGIGGAGDAGVGGSGVVPAPVIPDDTSGTFQPPSGGSVLDAGSY
ncbi:Erp protein [Myxococcus stipitatus]|uniref:Erp protein n=1 Tax=Myxococcus stipitatus TaxID=83455 RepID=UPI00314561AF